MCMFCAAVPVAGAMGAKMNADQKRKTSDGQPGTEKPIAAITTGVIVLLVAGSIIYHATLYGKA